MDSGPRDAYKEITFKFDDVVVHRRSRTAKPPPETMPTTTREEEDFRRNCRDLNTSTPKKDVKMAISEARSSFFGLDEGPAKKLTDSQMDTADLLATLDDSATINDAEEEQSSCKTCDINNNHHQHNNSNKSKSESGLGSISDEPSDEPDSAVHKTCPEKEMLLDGDEDGGASAAPRNIIREPQYYPPDDDHHNPSQVSFIRRILRPNPFQLDYCSQTTILSDTGCWDFEKLYRIAYCTCSLARRWSFRYIRSVALVRVASWPGVHNNFQL